MAMTKAERQNRCWHKIRVPGFQRVEAILPFEVAIKLAYLAAHGECSKTEAPSRTLLETWR